MVRKNKRKIKYVTKSRTEIAQEVTKRGRCFRELGKKMKK